MPRQLQCLDSAIVAVSDVAVDSVRCGVRLHRVRHRARIAAPYGAPWTRRFHYSLRGGAPYHPNLPGMQAVADLLAAGLSLIEYRRCSAAAINHR